MTCIKFEIDGKPSGILCVDPATGPYRITVGNSRWWFEWSARWGPLVVRRNGGTAEQPGWRSPFWRAACIWSAQGKRTHLQNALWQEPPEGIDYVRRLGKRTVLHIRSEYPEGFLEDYSHVRMVEVTTTPARDGKEG